MRYFKELRTKKFAVYFTRWQVSALVMMPFMITLEYLGWPLWLNLMVGQSIGALIFFRIDHIIFSIK